MAKGFYTGQEVAQRLGKSDSEIREMVREGQLREFRDGGKLMYKQEDVDKLASEANKAGTASPLGGSDAGDLVLDGLDGGGGPSGSGSAIPLGGSGGSGEMKLESGEGTGAEMDLSGSSFGAAGSSIALSGTDISDASAAALRMLADDSMVGKKKGGPGPGAGKSGGKGRSESSGSGIPLDLPGDSGAGLLGGSASALPLDLSEGSKAGGTDVGTGTDVFTLEEAEQDVAGGGKKDDTVITSVGISVFDDEDLEIDADPQAKTVMSDSEADLGVEGVGSGSGLLDLTRESDDTSLGAELLEEIYPGGEAAGDTGTAVGDETKAGVREAAEIHAMAEESFAAAAKPTPVVAPVSYGEDPLGPVFTGLLGVGLLILLLVGGLVSASTIRGVWPNLLEILHQKFWVFLGVTAGLAGLGALAGFLVSRSSTKRVPG